MTQRTLPPRIADHPIDPDILTRWSPLAFDGTALTGDDLASLFEAARLAHATIQPVAIRFTTPGGQFCEAAAYAGDTTFWQSICQILRTRAMVVELHYASAIPQGTAAEQTRFALSETSRLRIAGALGLPAQS